MDLDKIININYIDNIKNIAQFTHNLKGYSRKIGANNRQRR